MRQYHILLELLMDDNKYSLEDLKKLLGEKNNNNLLKSFFEIFLSSIEYIYENLDVAKFNYLLKCCYYIQDIILAEDDLNAQIIELKLIDCEKKLKIKQKEVSKNAIDCQNFIKKLRDKMESLNLSYQFVINNETKNVGCFFLQHLIFENRSYEIISKVLDTCPNLINIRDANNESIFTQIVNYYLELVKQDPDEEELVYFESIVRLINYNDEFQCSKHERKRYIEILNQAIDNLKRTSMKKKKRQQVAEKLEIIKIIIADKQKINKNTSLSERLRKLCGINEGFSDEVKKEVAIIIQNEILDDYIDRKFINGTIFTIDGVGARVIDDGISLEEIDGGYILGIHIADISHYIKEHSYIDSEALRRTSTIYFREQVFHMLPAELGIDIFSLNPDRRKRTISCFIHLDRNGNVINYVLCKTMANFIQKVECNESGYTLISDYDDISLQKKLEILSELSYLERTRLQKGALRNTFQSIESISGTNGQVVAPFMIMANHLVAKQFDKSGLPFIYRVQERSKSSLLDNLPIIKPLQIDVDNGNISEKEYNTIINVLLQRNLQGKYSLDNAGHYTLGLDAYSHCTSPIRRYVDLVNQRLMNTFLFNDPNPEEIKMLRKNWELRLNYIVEYINSRQVDNISNTNAKVKKKSIDKG